MNKLVLLTALTLSSSLMAAPKIDPSQLIGSFSVDEISSAEFKSFNAANALLTDPELPVPKPTLDQRVEQTGKIIQATRDLVALGEAIYTLAQKGKPSNITDYAPLSVVPRDPITKEYVNPFDLEGFSMPVEKNYSAKIVSGTGKEVVNFTYKIIYSYGGSYNGAGKYLTNVMIVPGSIRTSYGWDFNASMKLSGIMNHGTKADPIAGVMVTVKYQMNSWSAAFERNDTIHITGIGELKNFNM